MKWFYNLKRNDQKCITFFSWFISFLLIVLIDYDITFLVLFTIAMLVFTGYTTYMYNKAGKNNLYKDYNKNDEVKKLSSMTSSNIDDFNKQLKKADEQINERIKETNILLNEFGINTNNDDIVNDESVSMICLPIKTKIVGVTFENRQSFLRESCINDTITIKHTPNNDYPNTTYVINDRTNRILGCINNDLANKLLNFYGNHFILKGIIINLSDSSNEYIGCNISIDEFIDRGDN